MERTIVDLPLMYVNGGHRGFLVSVKPADAVAVLEPVLVDAAITR
jgi:prolyl-tRNA editing enzyme YbaK/EbsC (Cys-tRNA(Pro) deacylase)